MVDQIFELAVGAHWLAKRGSKPTATITSVVLFRGRYQSKFHYEADYIMCFCYDDS